EMGHFTRESLEAFGRNFNLRVRGQMLRDVNTFHKPEQDLVVRALQEAQGEILVLDHLTDEGVRPDIDMKPGVMKWHLDTMVARAQHGVTYRRYCQVADTDQPFQNLQARTANGAESEHLFATHCVVMCRMRSDANYDVILKVAPNIFPYKFMIVDRKVLVLQLQEVDAEDDDSDAPRS